MLRDIMQRTHAEIDYLLSYLTSKASTMNREVHSLAWKRNAGQ